MYTYTWMYIVYTHRTIATSMCKDDLKPHISTCIQVIFVGAFLKIIEIV